MTAPGASSTPTQSTTPSWRDGLAVYTQPRVLIVLRPGFAPSNALAREIQEFVKVQLAAHEYPRFVQFAESLPMTATGKVLRRELRALG